MSNVPEWSFEQLKKLPANKSAMWVTPSCQDTIELRLSLPSIDQLEKIPEEATTLLVVGGGKMIDQAKYFRAESQPNLQLICAPSLFGSGAEVSPVVVLDRNDAKEIHMEDRFLPDARAYLPELLGTVPDAIAHQAAGDVWSHALEGFLSPLADDALRKELATLLGDLLATPFDKTIDWFHLSARACAGQARSSVGLIHGFAHVLEAPLGIGHASLCSTMIKPVMSFNRAHSEKWDNLVQEYQLDRDALLARENELFQKETYARIRTVLNDHWKTILRDRCSRMNGVLLRPGHLDYFLETDFS